MFVGSVYRPSGGQCLPVNAAGCDGVL